MIHPGSRASKRVLYIDGKELPYPASAASKILLGFL